MSPKARLPCCHRAASWCLAALSQRWLSTGLALHCPGSPSVRPALWLWQTWRFFNNVKVCSAGWLIVVSLARVSWILSAGVKQAVLVHRLDTLKVLLLAYELDSSLLPFGFMTRWGAKAPVYQRCCFSLQLTVESLVLKYQEVNKCYY